MNNKKSKGLTYLLSGLIPIIIFLIAMCINKTYPFGSSLLNIYDSKDQYSSILLTIVRGIKNSSIFYSMNGGLGINLYATAAYYGTGILNFFAVLADVNNYTIYSTIMILIRFACLGLSMCFYLNKKGLKPIYIVLLSICYALMGFTAIYYYNYIWMDSIILLPIVIYGLEKLLDDNKPLVFIISLALAIISNFYIGYMITVFCILFFIYKLLIDNYNKKESIKMFSISVLLSVLVCMVVLLPTFYALLEGKIDVFERVDYFSFDKSVLSIFYSLTPGNYKVGDQIYGHALIYTGLFAFINSVLFFFNKSISKKEKIFTLVFISIFLLSIVFNLFNYAWHMFAKPIWFVYRFSFLVSFLIIYLSAKNLLSIDSLKITSKTKIILTTIIIILIEFSALYKLQLNVKNEIDNTYLGYYLILSFIAIIVYIFNTKNNKKHYIMISIFLLLELLLNTTVSVYENTLDAEVYNKQLIENYIKTSNKIKDKDKSFYRTDIFTSYLVNDGLMYNLYSLDYISSIRNNKINNFLVNTGLFNQSHLARVGLGYYDLPILNLYGVKYVIHENGKSYDTINNNLSLGFTTNNKIKYAPIKDVNDYSKNLNILYSYFIDEKSNFYKNIEFNSFNTTKHNKEYNSTYSFHSNGNYLIHLSNITYSIIVNDKKYTYKDFGTTFEIKKNDNISITYIYDNSIDKKDIKIVLLDLDKYNNVISKLKINTSELYNIQINKGKDIIKAEINVDNKYTYLFTTIGYEKGMKVYIDGKESKFDVLFDAIIGLELSKGNHLIQIRYIPRGFYEGLSISSLSLVLLVYYLCKNKKHFL